MNNNRLIVEVDKLLEEHRLRRTGATWNRAYDSFIDVIDLQFGKL
jgi:hypothetical protein